MMGYAPQGGGGGGVSFILEGEGSLVADGTAQVIFDITRLEPFKGQLYIDVSPLVIYDSITITEYIQKSALDALRKFVDVTFIGVQDAPMVNTYEKIIGYRHRLTLQQTLGPFKTFRWQYLSEVAA